jgi:hypothetical protein
MSITVACMLWHEAVVKDMFILPLSALFAFTSVRANMPGAPQGFGELATTRTILSDSLHASLHCEQQAPILVRLHLGLDFYSCLPMTL